VLVQFGAQQSGALQTIYASPLCQNKETKDAKIYPFQPVHWELQWGTKVVETL